MNEIQEAKRVEALFERISALIEQGRQRVVTAVNIAEVYTKYAIGQYIVDEEQKGESRAEYGKQVLKGLSERLTEQFGDGWSYSNLRQIRQFFLDYGNLTNSVCQIPLLLTRPRQTILKDLLTEKQKCQSCNI